MTGDEFQGLFTETDFAEITESLAEAEAEVKAEQAAEAAAKPKQNGLWYVYDGVDGNGHAISWYAVNVRGKTILWASVDNDLEVPSAQMAELGKIPAGISGHGIRVCNAERTVTTMTKGIALRAPHSDGTGTHIDGSTVRAYVLPRLLRFMAEFYGV